MINEIEEVEWKIAGSLFGKDNLKNDSFDVFASNPLALFCKDKINDMFNGDNVTGFRSKFCNQTTIVQTDVGICVNSNPTQYSRNGFIQKIESSSNIQSSLKETEHTIIIQGDRFASYTNDFSVRKLN